MTSTITPATHERLTTNLEMLRTKRLELTDAIAAAGRGDEVDMAQTSLAREEIARLDVKIREIRERLLSAVISERGITSGVVGAASLVEVLFDGDDRCELYLIDTSGEEVAGATAVSPASPLGAALLGCSVGDRASYNAPAGRIAFEVRAVR